MKYTLILALVVSMASISEIQAQINENVKEETTVEKVTIKDTNVETIVNKEIDSEKSVIKVEGTDKINQESKVEVVTDQVSKSIDVENKHLNTENEKDLKKMKKEEYKRVDGQQRVVPVLSKDQNENKKSTPKKDDGGK